MYNSAWTSDCIPDWYAVHMKHVGMPRGHGWIKSLVTGCMRSMFEEFLISSNKRIYCNYSHQIRKKIIHSSNISLVLPCFNNYYTAENIGTRSLRLFNYLLSIDFEFSIKSHFGIEFCLYFLAQFMLTICNHIMISNTRLFFWKAIKYLMYASNIFELINLWNNTNFHPIHHIEINLFLWNCKLHLLTYLYWN